MGRHNSLAPAAGTFQKGKGRVSGITLDAGGLIAVDRNDRRILTLLVRAKERALGDS